MKSKKWILNARDYIHGLLMTAAGAAVVALYPILQVGNLPSIPQIKQAVACGLGVGAFYLLKNLTSNSNGQLLKLEPKTGQEKAEQKK